jgi:RNA polymerase sigma-70 factor (ECF subfamily)
MARSPCLPDLAPIYRLAEQEARRLCRGLGLPAQEREDLRQDLLTDFLARLPAFDPAKGALEAFARICFRHAATRIARRVQRERAGRHPLSLDDALPGGDGLTLGDTLGEADGYAAWCGQATLWPIATGGDEDAATVHGTQKPVECICRPLRRR